MSSRPPIDGSTSRPRPIEVAIVGNDALVAALPARPVQLSHALHAMGYDFVVPVSWGEEIVAEHALRALNAHRQAPVIFCACARVRERLLASGSELSGHIVALVSPAVAAARYLRALQPTIRMRVTYIGSCDTGGDAAINATLTPHDLLKRLAERGIAAVRQPAVFDSVIPPDRRRFFSMPGGCPAPSVLASHAPEWHHVTVDDEAFAASLAELVLSGDRVVIDLTPLLGCACCAVLGHAALDENDAHAPTQLGELEPPRSSAPVLDHDIEVSVDAPLLRPRRALPSDSVALGVLTRERAEGAAERADDAAERAESAATLPVPHEAQQHDQLLRDRILREGASAEGRGAASELSHGAGAGRPPASATQRSPSAATPSIRTVEQLSPPAVAHEPIPRDAIRPAEQESATRGGDHTAAQYRDASGAESEREVQRTALPADAPPPRRVFGSLRLEGGHEGAARRRIAVTPPSVPVMPLRGGAAASLGAGGAAALRVPVALPANVPVHEPAVAPEVTPAIGVPSVQAHPSSVEAPRAPVPVLPITSSRTEGATLPNDAPASTEKEAQKPARGRTVHDAFGVARRAARARSARLAAARLRRPQSETETARTAEIETSLATAPERSGPSTHDPLQASALSPEGVAAARVPDDEAIERAHELPVHDIWVEAELQAKLADFIASATAEVEEETVRAADDPLTVAEHWEKRDVESDPATIVEEVVVTATVTTSLGAPLDPTDGAPVFEDEAPISVDELPNGHIRIDPPNAAESSAAVVVGLPSSNAPFSFPVESPRPGPRVIRGRGRPTRAPIVTHTERKREEPEERRPDEPHPMVTLAITVVAVIAVLIALALVLQRNPLAP